VFGVVDDLVKQFSGLLLTSCTFRGCH